MNGEIIYPVYEAAPSVAWGLKQQLPKRGIEVEAYTLKNGVSIDAIVCEGKRDLVIPVVGVEPKEVVYAASIGQTRTGRPKLFARVPERVNTKDALLLLIPFPEEFGARVPLFKLDLPHNEVAGNDIAVLASGFRRAYGNTYFARVPVGTVFDVILHRRRRADIKVTYTWDGEQFHVDAQEL